MSLKKKVTIAAAVTLAAMMSLSACGGSGSTTAAEKDDNSLMTVEVFDGLANYQGEQKGWFAKIIKDKFNIKLNIVAPNVAGGGSTLFDTRAAAGNLGDIVIYGYDTGKGAKLVKSGLIEDMTPYLKGMKYINKYKDATDYVNEQIGQKSGVWGVPASVVDTLTPDQPSEGLEPTFGPYLRWDLYKEIGSPEIKNDDDYVEALKKMKEIYPETEDGLPVYALSAYNDSNLHPYFFIGCLTQGYSNMESGLYVKNMKTNELVPDIYDVNLNGVTTPFWAGISFYNKLYKADLLDPDCFISKGEDLTEKYTKGQYLGGYVNWHYGNWNKNARAEDPETMKQFVILPAYMGWANERNFAGWQGKYFLVSSHSKNIERAVMILDYLQSEECARIVDSGVEGRWEIGEDGKPALTEDTIDMKSNTARAEEWTKSGIGATFSDMVGYDPNNIASDGSAISLWEKPDIMVRNLTAAEKDMCKEFGIELPSDLLKKKMEAGESMDMSAGNSAIQFGMEIVPSDIGRIDSNCEQITINAIPGLVQAKTDEEFQAAKEALMAELKAAGAEDSIAWWTQAWNTSKEAVENMQ